MLRVIAAFLVSSIISYLVVPYIIELANMIGAIDVPEDGRRVHKTPIPRIGGLAIFIGFLISAMKLMIQDAKKRETSKAALSSKITKIKYEQLLGIEKR